MDILELVHEDRSSASRPFACEFDACSKAFSRRSDLVRHLRIHSNERPFLCSWPGCKRDFIQRSALTVHMRVHTGERPHECEYEGCHKAFSDSSSLARHRRIHTGKRPYKCPIYGCRKTFCRKTTLVKHVKRNHPEAPPIPRGSAFLPNYDYNNREADAAGSPTSSSPGTPSDDGDYAPAVPGYYTLPPSVRTTYHTRSAVRPISPVSNNSTWSAPGAMEHHHNKHSRYQSDDDHHRIYDDHSPRPHMHKLMIPQPTFGLVAPQGTVSPSQVSRAEGALRGGSPCSCGEYKTEHTVDEHRPYIVHLPTPMSGLPEQYDFMAPVHPSQSPSHIESPMMVHSRRFMPPYSYGGAGYGQPQDCSPSFAHGQVQYVQQAPQPVYPASQASYQYTNDQGEAYDTHYGIHRRRASSAGGLDYAAPAGPGLAITGLESSPRHHYRRVSTVDFGDAQMMIRSTSFPGLTYAMGAHNKMPSHGGYVGHLE